MNKNFFIHDRGFIGIKYKYNPSKFFFHSDKVILNNALDIERGKTNVTSTMKYFHSISEYMLELRKVLEQLRDDIE